MVNGYFFVVNRQKRKSPLFRELLKKIYYINNKCKFDLRIHNDQDCKNAVARGESANSVILFNGGTNASHSNACKRVGYLVKIKTSLASIGVRSIRSTVEKHNGICRFSAHDGVFTALIIMDE